MKNQDLNYIHPEDLNNITYWTKKWGISVRELKDAILYTGSIKTDDIKLYLRNNIPDNSFWLAIKRRFIN